MPRKESTNVPASAQAQQDAVSEGIENFELPRTLVTKIAKSAIPDNTKLQKDTVLSLVKGSTVFINYLAATAHDVAHSKQHKSISASDVLKALEMIEFADLVAPLQAELQVYRDSSKGKKGSISHGSASISTPTITLSAPTASHGAGKSGLTPRAKGKERAEAAVSAPLPTGGEYDSDVVPNGIQNGYGGEADEDMVDAAEGEGEGTEEGEGFDDDEIDEERDEDEGDGDVEDVDDDDDEEQAEEDDEGDVAMGGLQENHADEHDEED